MKRNLHKTALILASFTLTAIFVFFANISVQAQTLNIVTKTSTVQIKTIDIDSATVQTTTFTIIKKDKTTQVIAIADILRMTFTLPTGVANTNNTANLGNILGLIKAYPNPASATTAIEYELSQPASVEAQIVDASGTLTKTISLGTQQSGAQTVQWDATNNAGATVASGSYTCVIRTSNGAMITQKIIIVR